MPMRRRAGADAVVIVTEWDIYPRARPRSGCGDAWRRAVLVDLRNVYPPDEIARTGFAYSSIGR